MYQFMYEAKEIFEDVDLERVPDLIQRATQGKQVVKPRELSRLAMYMDLFPVVQRCNRHYSAAFLTESFERQTVEDRSESEEEDSKVDESKFKTNTMQYYKQHVREFHCLEYQDI